MADNPWKAPPEFAEMVERNRAAFKGQFGSFDDALIDRYWLGTSEDGSCVAFQFYRPDGTIHRFALPPEMVPQFVIEFAGATDEMNDRRLAVGLAAAQPKGEA
ncbi:hypothetical protein EN875_034030 [Mesorhizobium sp. M2D.F.Ca.ET.232.01.1.1]|uniref:hypothetical protein n=1 Tax=Mesorhizobium sp. M2D.F.Ca.ET.232.01.1.1 TaxID=2496670 RepID=UPI000FCA2DC6|nr:hypothetical protein [Mesorhizobium sp. M2D.F.Ca.ET.232.01.1.1]TGP27361.1 hypothetical protein EN875_034030 [Mesorhizobium sp. M2D.F.Ca.ET.232.01.1.1]